MTMRTIPVSRPAPVKGLVLDQAGTPDPAGAEVLENWFPTRRGIRVRGGRARVTTLDAPVTSLFSYVGSGSSQGFAATEDKLFPITTFDPITVPTPIRTGRSSGMYVTYQTGTIAGQFLIACNGADPVLTYDGATWTDTVLTFSPSGPSSSDLSAVWGYRNRLMFIEKGTMTCWYLPINAISGLLEDFSLAGVFELGGNLLFGATISMDAGDGIDDRCVFVSDQGEVAVYEGADPGSLTDWRLVGRYQIGIPLGPKAWIRAGGDLMILTVSGAVSLTQAMQADAVSLIAQAVTQPIQPLWVQESQRRNGPWQIERWAEKSIAIVAVPGMDRGQCLIISLDTGAWSVATNWGATCLSLFGDRMVAGIGDAVFALDEGGLDEDSPFIAKLCMSFAAAPDNVRKKIASLIRATYYAPTQAVLRFGVSRDYAVTFPDAPAVSPSVSSPQVWGVFRWGVSVWTSISNVMKQTYVTRWSRVRGSGIALAPTVQILSGSSIKLDVELVQVDMLIEAGDVVA